MRYCGYFLNIRTWKERKNDIRFRRVCGKCLKTGHNTSTCRARIECNYCVYASKPANHNSALCTFLTDCQFEAIIENKDKLGVLYNQKRQAKVKGNKNDDTSLVKRMRARTKLEIEGKGEKQVVDLHSILTSTRQPLRCIGQVALG